MEFFFGLGSKYRRTGLPFKASPNGLIIHRGWIFQVAPLSSIHGSFPLLDLDEASALIPVAAPALAALIMPAFGCDYLGEFRGVGMGRDGFWYIYVGEKKRFFFSHQKGYQLWSFRNIWVKNCRCYRVGGWTQCINTWYPKQPFINGCFNGMMNQIFI